MKIKSLFSLFFILSVLCEQNVFAQPYYTWFQLNIPTTNDILFIANASNNIFATGKNGVILKKASNTSLWVMQNSTVTSDLNWYFNANSTDWVCGNNGVILKSTNSGANWTTVGSATLANLNAIQRFNNSNYGAFGTNGVYSFSSNAGANWSIQTAFTDQTINSVASGGFYYFICGNNGVVFKSTDFGVTWSSIRIIPNVNLNSVSFSDMNTGWVAGDNGYIAYTTNSGASWSQQVSTTSLKLNSISFGGGSTVFAAGDNSLVIKSTNMGSNWSGDNFTFSGGNLNHLFMIGETGYAAGDNGKIFIKKIDTTYTFNTTLESWETRSHFYDKLILNRNYNLNGLGLEWPRGSSKFLGNALGLNITAKVNGNLRTATAFQKSEFAPGYAQNGVYNFDSRFRIYKVLKDSVNSYSWQNWGNMVPFGAPFVDVNLNGMYEPSIDKPGIKDARETNFICVSDAADSLHNITNGYGAGTLPLGAEIHFTYWSIDFRVDTAHIPVTDAAVFMKYEIINKSNNVWTNTYFSFLNDGMIGDPTDDYIGCDTLREMAYYYNADYVDGTGSPGHYGAAPPAWACAIYKGAFLNSNPAVDLGMTSMGYFYGTTGCTSVNMTTDELYNMAKGFKKDGTPWVNIQNNQTTKYNYTGDPAGSTGWTEFNGRVLNCGGSTSGSTEIPSVPGKRYTIFSTGSESLTMNPGDKQVIIVVQAVSKGTGNLNSILKLKTLIDSIRSMYYVPRVSVKVQSISSIIPEKFSLQQNYPNPFNPSTNIKFALTNSDFVSLKIFDIIGKEVTNLVNESLKPGTYEVNFNAANLPSGIYFYSLNTETFNQTKKMILIK